MKYAMNRLTRFVRYQGPAMEAIQRLLATSSSCPVWSRGLSDYKPFNRHAVRPKLEQAVKPIGPMSTQDLLDSKAYFVSEAEYMIDEIYNAILPMKEQNPGDIS